MNGKQKYIIGFIVIGLLLLTAFPTLASIIWTERRNAALVMSDRPYNSNNLVSYGKDPVAGGVFVATVYLRNLNCETIGGMPRVQAQVPTPNGSNDENLLVTIGCYNMPTQTPGSWMGGECLENPDLYWEPICGYGSGIQCPDTQLYIRDGAYLNSITCGAELKYVAGGQTYTRTLLQPGGISPGDCHTIYGVLNDGIDMVMPNPWEVSVLWEKDCIPTSNITDIKVGWIDEENYP